MEKIIKNFIGGMLLVSVTVFAIEYNWGWWTRFLAFIPGWILILGFNNEPIKEE